MMQCRCTICGKTLDPFLAFIKEKNGIPRMYCSESEYNMYIKDTKKKEETRKDVDFLMHYILGESLEFPNSVKQVVEKWKEVAGSELLETFLNQKCDFLRVSIEHMSGEVNIFMKIRYLSAILDTDYRGFIDDCKRREEMAKQAKERADKDIEDFDLYVNTHKFVRKKGFSELEEETKENE